ncbi:prolyl oligopeptidase family serine peptidase, partial [Rhizobium johnstonii]|uniref:prolyl oligopeptidase family serine peptidase n=1 Tax=Rhizobium johnstonii TaxID=3019933 RepID=UPI003F97B89A
EVRSETLLLHGKHDDRAPVSQAERFSKALSNAGVLADAAHLHLDAFHFFSSFKRRVWA